VSRVEMIEGREEVVATDLVSVELNLIDPYSQRQVRRGGLHFTGEHL
jgi:hypothetical protein